MITLNEIQAVTVESQSGRWQVARQHDDRWLTDNAIVRLVPSENQFRLFVTASGPLSTVEIDWPWELPAGSRILNDHWERGYGDLCWLPANPERVLPWYMAVSSPEETWGIGVGTRARAFCRWETETMRLRLVCDLRAGKDPVELGDRELHVADIVQIEGRPGESAWQVVRELCGKMCTNPLSTCSPVYGFNDWYYAYGSSTQQTIARDAKFLGELTEGLPNRPFCVVDAGYQLGRTGCSGAPFHATNRFFPDMKGLADEMREANVRPGLWVRVLRTQERVPENWLRQAPADRSGDLLDPTVPEAVEYAMDCLKPLIDDWGYELVKHDFSTFDIFGRWGFEMGTNLFNPAYASFRHRDRTTAEIILDLYRGIRQACGNAVVIGCNTVGHLAAGLVEVQRIGDDTSGRAWARTRKMGVNTLAFRSVQQDTFFAADADCVGLTDRIPWELNRQWLDLLARSGTPLFVSADPGAVGTPQREALIAAFVANSVPQPVAEPLDWVDNMVPQHWLLQGKETDYEWFEDAGSRRGY